MKYRIMALTMLISMVGFSGCMTHKEPMTPGSHSPNSPLSGNRSIEIEPPPPRPDASIRSIAHVRAAATNVDAKVAAIADTNSPVIFPSITKSPKSGELKMLTRTHLFTVSGAIPVKQDGLVFFYRKRCLKCGYERKRMNQMTIPGGISISSSKFTCPKCRHEELIRIAITPQQGGNAAGHPLP